MKCFVPQMGFSNAYAPSSSSSVVVNKLAYFVSQMAFGNAYVPLSSSSSYQQWNLEMQIYHHKVYV
jgi:hypothetical protein